MDIINQWFNGSYLKAGFWLAFFLWGLPLNIYRSRFRKMVYKTNDWIINIKPVFWKELKVLFGIIKLDSKEQIKLRNFYRFYLVIYFILLYLALK